MAKTKICCRCKKEKPKKDFSINKSQKSGLHSFCKECKRKEYVENRCIILSKAREKRYGIAIAVYNKMFEEQQGYCMICGKHQSELKRALSVDHNHHTGRIRGLLCGSCNTAIGSLRADFGLGLLQKAIEYIKEYDGEVSSKLV